MFYLAFRLLQLLQLLLLQNKKKYQSNEFDLCRAQGEDPHKHGFLVMNLQFLPDSVKQLSLQYPQFPDPSDWYVPVSSSSVGHQSPPESLSGFAQPWCSDPSTENVHGNIHCLLSVVKHAEVERNEKYTITAVLGARL